MNLLKANHTGQPRLQSLLPSWMDECISQSRRAGRQSRQLGHMPVHATCAACHMLQARRHGSLARFMFNEMFGRFLQNLHYTATTGPVAGSLACLCCPFTCHCCQPEKVHKMARSVSSSASSCLWAHSFWQWNKAIAYLWPANEIVKFFSAPSPLPSAPAPAPTLQYCLALWQWGHA